MVIFLCIGIVDIAVVDEAGICVGVAIFDG